MAATRVQKAAAKAVQYALQATGANIVADGIVGRRTMEAISESTSPSVSALVKEFPDVMVAPQAPAVAGKSELVSNADLAVAYHVVDQRYGPELVRFVEQIFRQEGRVDAEGIYTVYDQQYSGLGQFALETWENGRRAFLNDAPEYEVGKRSAVWSALMTAAYAVDHRSRFVKLANREGFTGAYSPGIAYIYHQQGAQAGDTFLLTGNLVYPKQSLQSIAFMKEARATVV